MSQEDAMDAALTASDKACMEKADDFKASKVAVEQLPTPASSSSTENPEVPSIKVESTRASRASKRNRETTPDALGPLTPPRSSKKPRTPAKTPAQEEEAVTKKAAALRKKADEAAVKAANAAKRKAAADAKKAETQRKKQVAQWKRDWKDWVTTNQIPDERFTAFEQDCLTVTKSKEYLGIQKDELQCLPHDTRPNPNGPFAPMRLYKYEEVVDLAYKKEAILAGVSQVDDETLIACGKKLWEAKKAPVLEYDEIRLGRPSPIKASPKKASPLKRRMPDSDDDGYSSAGSGYDPCENNIPDISWLQTHPEWMW